MDLKKAAKRRISLYRNRKKMGVPLKELLAYDSILLFKREERIKAGKRILKKRGRYYAKQRYNLEFTENSDVDEIFTDNIYSIYSDFIPKEGQVVVDIGAQYGDYAILCSKVYKAKVYTFEPLPENFKEITENIKLNGLNERQIQAFNVALGNKDKTEILSYSGEMANNFGEGNRIEVEFRTLDSYKIKPDLMKIDVEGFELDVLEGAIETIKKYHPKIIIETHSKELEKKTKEFLSRFDYRLKHEGRSIYNVNDKFDKVTNLFFE